GQTNTPRRWSCLPPPLFEIQGRLLEPRTLFHVRQDFADERQDHSTILNETSLRLIISTNPGNLFAAQDLHYIHASGPRRRNRRSGDGGQQQNQRGTGQGWQARQLQVSQVDTTHSRQGVTAEQAESESAKRQHDAFSDHTQQQAAGLRSEG